MYHFCDCLPPSEDIVAPSKISNRESLDIDLSLRMCIGERERKMVDGL
jgi:hypothetical protein